MSRASIADLLGEAPEPPAQLSEAEHRLRSRQRALERKAKAIAIADSAAKHHRLGRLKRARESIKDLLGKKGL